jgi:hypothetical protein
MTTRGICVDAEGATLGPDCVLVRRTPGGFRAIRRDDASTVQKCLLDGDHDHDWLFHRCQSIADLLDKGELALAQIYGLHIPIGDLDDLQLKQLARVYFAKAGYNPDEPRIPKGDHGGGEWTTGDAIDAAPSSNVAPSAVPLRALDVESADTDGSPPMEFRIVSPDTDTAPQEAAPESNSSSETTAGVSPTRGTNPASTVGEREAASHHSPGNSGSAADYHGDAINPDYSIENLLFLLGTGGSSWALRRALAAIGVFRPTGFVTHHIVAQRALIADPARKVLERLGINVDGAVNGVFLPAAQHRRLHSIPYYTAINKALADAKTKAEAEDILRSIIRQLEEGSFP